MFVNFWLQILICGESDKDVKEFERLVPQAPAFMLAKIWEVMMRSARGGGLGITLRQPDDTAAKDFAEVETRRVLDWFYEESNVVEALTAQPFNKHFLEAFAAAMALYTNPTREWSELEKLCRLCFSDARAWFRTKEKAIYGSLYAEAQPGDEVWFVCGLNVPVLLRPNTNGNFQFIGEVYIDGFMQGQIFETNWIEGEEKLINLE
jgi:hypothetical protein